MRTMQPKHVATNVQVTSKLILSALPFHRCFQSFLPATAHNLYFTVCSLLSKPNFLFWFIQTCIRTLLNIALAYLDSLIHPSLAVIPPLPSVSAEGPSR